MTSLAKEWGPRALTLGKDGSLYGIISSNGAIFKCTLLEP